MIVLAAVEPGTGVIFLRLKIELAKAERAALHTDGVADRFIEPRPALINLAIAFVSLVQFDHEGVLPMLVRPDFRALYSF